MWEFWGFRGAKGGVLLCEGGQYGVSEMKPCADASPLAIC